jgi:hypothetical protein
MTIDKLQRLGVSIVEPKFKARWLRWWNASDEARRAYRFPLPKDKDYKDPKAFEHWIHKAAFWAEVHIISTLPSYMLSNLDSFELYY